MCRHPNGHDVTRANIVVVLVTTAIAGDHGYAKAPYEYRQTAAAAARGDTQNVCVYVVFLCSTSCIQSYRVASCRCSCCSCCCCCCSEWQSVSCFNVAGGCNIQARKELRRSGEVDSIDSVGWTGCLVGNLDTSDSMRAWCVHSITLGFCSKMLRASAR